MMLPKPRPRAVARPDLLVAGKPLTFEAWKRASAESLDHHGRRSLGLGLVLPQDHIPTISTPPAPTAPPDACRQCGAAVAGGELLCSYCSMGLQTRKRRGVAANTLVLILCMLMMGFCTAVSSVSLYMVMHRDAKPSTADFVAIGRTYWPVILEGYAKAWEQAADAVDAGTPIAKAVGDVRANWEASRTPIYNAEVASKFALIVPEGAPDASIAPTSRQALAAAFRSFAKGLRP